MKSIFALFLFFVTSFHGSFFAQTLTISTSGQTGTSGTNWYVSGSNPVRIIGTQTANVNTSVVQGYINSGVDVLIFSIGEIAIQNDLTKNNSGRLILRPGNNTISGAGKITLGNNAQLLLSNGATISNNIELVKSKMDIVGAKDKKKRYSANTGVKCAIDYAMQGYKVKVYGIDFYASMNNGIIPNSKFSRENAYKVKIEPVYLQGYKR
jgi:hypothetical protein